MKLSTKIILPIILISALLILLAGCFGTPDEEPGYTPGTITGIIAAPCCSTSAEPVSETCCIAPEYWCYYCQETWSLQDGVEVILTYGEDEIATTTTNENGEFTFTDVSPGKNYVITALCPDYTDDRPLVKDVAFELIEGGSFDTKITDLVSTSLGLVVDFLIDFTILGPEDIVLDDVIADKPDFPNFPKFKNLIYEVRIVGEKCEDLTTDDDVQYALCLAAEEISKLTIGCGPGYTPPPPPPGACDGNSVPSINSVLLDGTAVSIGESVHVVVGTPYVITVNATDDGKKDPLIYYASVDGVESAVTTSNQITVTPTIPGTFEVFAFSHDGCAETKWGPVTVVVCPPLDPALAITISDETPCYGTCATISKITVSYTDGVTPKLEIVPTYEGKNLTWIKDPGITFNPVDGTVCLDELNDGQVGVDYNIEFTYTDECSGTATAIGTATVNFAGPIANANGDYEGVAICGSMAPNVTLDGSGSTVGGTAIVSYEWYEGTTLLGSGVSLPYYFAPGDYTVTLVVTDENGCFDSAEALVGIDAVDGPAADANGDYEGVAICGSMAPNVTLDGSGSTVGGTAIVSYEWYEGTTLLGSGVSLPYYFAPGDYTVTLVVTDENGCFDSAEALVGIDAVDGPAADANGDYEGVAICGSMAPNVTLDGSGSTVGGTAIVSYEWYEGTTLLGSGVSLPYYFAPGDYTVTLVVTDENGCFDSAEALVGIDAVDGPAADANGDYEGVAICGSMAPNVTLDGSGSTVGGTAIVSYEWYEGTTLLGSGVSLPYYFAPGDYTVTLVVTDENGCFDSAEALVGIDAVDGPAADANGDYEGVAICGSMAPNVTLDGSGSTVGGTAIVSYEWYEGTTLLGSGVSLPYYFAPGDYTVTLVVTDENGCFDSAEALVGIDAVDGPAADANGDYEGVAICGSMAPNVTLDGSGSTVGGTAIVSYEWYEGTTLLGSGVSLPYYFAPGDYTVTLVVTDENGCFDSAEALVGIDAVDGPAADANGDYEGVAICGSMAPNVTLDGSGSTVGGTAIVSYEWYEGTTLLGSGVSLPYYFAPGDYTVTLVVTDENGCFDSAEALVGIDAVDGPAADANGDYEGVAICGSMAPNVTLDGSGSTVGGTAIVSYEWYEGTTLLGSGVSLPYYFAPGDYTVTLVVTDENGCFDSAEALVGIDAVDGPAADANGDYEGVAICGSMAPNVTLDGSGSTVGGTAIVSYEWYEGTTLLGSGVSLPYYFAPGDYTVTLVVTDENGCFDSAEALVGIDAVDGPAADANGDYEGVAICGSMAPNVTLDGSGSTVGGTAIVSYEWYEGTTLLGSGVSLPYYFAPGDYTVTLVVTDENGCFDSAEALVGIDAVCNDLNYLLIRGYHALSGCTGLQKTLEKTPTVPHDITIGDPLNDLGLNWLFDKSNETPNVKNINFIVRYDNPLTTIEYKYKYKLYNKTSGDTTDWIIGSDWSYPATGSLADDGTYGYGFQSGCMRAPSIPNDDDYCVEFELEIRVNGDSNTYTVNVY